MRNSDVFKKDIVTNEYFMDGNRVKVDTRILDYVAKNPSSVPEEMRARKRKEKRRSMGLGFAKLVLCGFCGWFIASSMGTILANLRLVLVVLAFMACGYTLAWVIQEAVER